jgi:hypothetical protein
VSLDAELDCNVRTNQFRKIRKVMSHNGQKPVYALA